MTPSAQKSVPQDVAEMLARAKPRQLARLLQDIKNAPPVAKEPVKYDA